MALVIQMAILNWINNKNTAKMSEVLLDRVVNVIEKNEDDEKNMITSLKEDYIVRAKAVAYIINEIMYEKYVISCLFLFWWQIRDNICWFQVAEIPVFG